MSKNQSLTLPDPTAFVDYLNVYKKLGNQTSFDKSTKTIRIAYLSSFSANGMKEVLFVKYLQVGILANVYVSPYNQYQVDIMNIKSRLYQHKPQLVFLFIDTRSLLGDRFLLPYAKSDSDQKKWLDETHRELLNLVSKLKASCDAKLVFHNFEVPSYSPMGILESKQRLGLIETVQTINARLRASFKDDRRVFLFDYDSLCSTIGKTRILDHKMYYLGDFKINPQYFPDLCDAYLSYAKPMMSLARKCIVLDLDNTLWGGTLGEDGMEGIRLGTSPEGKAFVEFQKYLLALHQRGILLVINSRNDAGEAIRVLNKHPNMVLKEKHFAAMQINWNDKFSNMKALSDELNIGLDSFVFIDDDERNRELIRKLLPEILVPDWPDDPSLFPSALMKINDFNSLQITEEDKLKGRLYTEQKQRYDLQKKTVELADYLKKLETVVTIEQASAFHIPRLSQLTQKTNQFNMTTRRYLEEHIERFTSDSRFSVQAIHVSDRFGDNGISGMILVEKNGKSWKIDTFLLSCRVIGRQVEEAVLANLLQQAGDQQAQQVIGEFILTKKNEPAVGFYKKNGFQLIEKRDEIEIWEYRLNQKRADGPNFIRVVYK